MKKSLFLLIALSFSIFSNAQSQAYLDSIPDHWEVDTTTISFVDDVSNWWTIFDDPVLNELLEETVRNNLNIKIAIQRIEQGRLLYKQSKAYYFPYLAFDISTLYQNNTPASTGDTNNTDIHYDTDVTMNWEIDVFGRIRKNVKVAQYSYEQAQEDQKNVMVSMLGDVSSAYIRLRTYQNQIIVTEQNIEAQERALRIAQNQFENGMKSQLDVYQSESILYTTRSSINTLQAQVINEINLIQIYLGQFPQGILKALNQPKELPEIPEKMQTLLPVDVVQQRPDIRSVEKSLMGMIAREELANAQMLPVLAITGQIGFSTYNSSDWFNSESMNYFIGPTLSWDIFQGLYKRKNKQIAHVQFQQTQLNYQNTVLIAMQEVQNSLTNIKELKASYQWIDKSVTASSNAFNLSLEQYEQGMIDYQPVINSQQSLLSVQNRQVQTKGNLLGQIVGLYQALGGNWVE